MDLKSQLAARFGLPEPGPAPEPPATADEGPLADGAWRDHPWAPRLLQLLATVPSPPKLARPASLGNQRQATDQLVKLLKKAGRGREAAELAGLRDDFMAARDKAAWTRIKGVFAEQKLPEKVYRRLKQEGADPVAVLGRLAGDLSSLGADRLYQHLAH